MIQPCQIDLVRSSFAEVVPITAATAADFYDRLFARAPDTRALFTNDMEEQGRKLFMTLAVVVDALDRLDEIVPVARELAIRHVRYGAKERHYAAVGEALIAALRATLGAGFDTATETAWADTYGLIASVMLDAHRAAA